MAETEVDGQVTAAMETDVLAQAQGHTFVMEQGRLSVLEGKMGMREAMTHRLIGEAGNGQARTHLPAGVGGVPTSRVAST